MRARALAAQCAALLLVFGASARAEEPVSEETEKGSTAKSASLPLEGAKREQEQPVYPPPYSRWAVIGVGLATTAVSYGAAAGMSYAFPDAPGAQDLRKPIIGPWLAIAHNGCGTVESECSQVWIVMRSIAEAIGGLAQAGGLLVAMEGVFIPTQYTPAAPVRRAPPAPTEPAPSSDPPKSEPPKPGDKNLFWIPTPMALGTGGVGMGVVGRF